jgi:hypothetical protein
MNASDLPVGILIAIAEAAIKIIPEIVEEIMADAKLDEREVPRLGEEGVSLLDAARAAHNRAEKA